MARLCFAPQPPPSPFPWRFVNEDLRCVSLSSLLFELGLRGGREALSFPSDPWLALLSYLVMEKMSLLIVRCSK